jgi:hypothetical protein
MVVVGERDEGRKKLSMTTRVSQNFTSPRTMYMSCCRFYIS